MSPGALVVRSARLAEVHDLQQAVLRPRGPLPGDTPPPPGALHVAAFEDGHVVAAATVLAAPWPGPGSLASPTWQLRGVVVRPDRQGRGLGRRVVDLAVLTAHEHGAATCWAAARQHALPFYLRGGWSPVGELWDKVGVGPHRWVVQALDGDRL